MANDSIGRRAGFIPRKSYPQVNDGLLRSMMLKEGLDSSLAGPMSKVLRTILDKQAIDERINYTAIEESLGGGGLRPASVVVAAPDSIDSSKADMVVPASSAQVVINEALNIAAGTNGGSVLLLDGTYNITDHIFVEYDGVALYGVGNSTRIVQSGTNKTGILCWSDNQLIHSLRLITTSGESTDPADWTEGLYGIEILGSNTVVRDVRVDGFEWGFEVVGDHARVFSCYAVECREGMQISSYGAVISGNVLDAIYGQGIALYNVASVIAHNVITVPSGNGINVGSDVSQIIGNQIFRATGHGIYVSDAGAWNGSRNLIQGNLIADASDNNNNTYDGIHIAAGVNNMVEGNQVAHNTTFGTQKVRYGVRIEAGATDTWVTNNNVYGAYVTAGISDAGTGTVTAAGNRT